MRRILIQFLLALSVFSAPLEDKVESLPEMNEGKPFPFNLYSGYLSANTRNLFYVLAESHNDPPTDPLIVWFNGGPGCSSMIGFL